MNLGGAALALCKESHRGGKVSQLGCENSGNKLYKQKQGPWRQVQRVSLGRAAAASAPLAASVIGTLRA